MVCSVLGGYYCHCSVAQSCPILCDPMDCSMPGLPVHHHFPEFAQLMSAESVMPSNHLILCRPLLLLPSLFLSIRVFSSESALHIKWPKYWSFNLSISPSHEYSGLISFRMVWLDLAIEGLSRIFFRTTVQKHQYWPPSLRRHLCLCVAICLVYHIWLFVLSQPPNVLTSLGPCTGKEAPPGLSLMELSQAGERAMLEPHSPPRPL